MIINSLLRPDNPLLIRRLPCNAINNFDHALCAGYAQTVVVVTGGTDGSSGRESRELSRMTGRADNDKFHINPLFFAQ